ncbi:MAG: NAD(P)H-dependent oxidoreductase subunit E, partial [Methylococcales bacterium]
MSEAQHKSRRKKKKGSPKGRPVDLKALANIKALLGNQPRRRDLLIEHLHKIQDNYGFISAAHVVALAHEMQLSAVEVYEVATFYHHFDVVKEGETPPPPLTVRVCDSVSCELAGAQPLLASLQQGLGENIRVIPAPCVGRCQHAPVAIVGQNPVDHATTDNVSNTVNNKDTEPHIPNYINYAEYKKLGGYQLYIDCINGNHTVDNVIQIMNDSGLRGLGGAGFPAGKKWGFVKSYAGPRLMAVNIDEGEPGTFKDRHYLEADPHRFIEGALIAAWAVGIDEIYIYLRDEYSAARKILTDEIAALQAKPPTASIPLIHLRRGAGAYICGEESSMIESIEGKRGIPRQRPPFLAE